MAIKRIVSTEFWTDSKVVEDFTPEDKLFMLYLLTNPHSSALGIYQIGKKTMAFELGYSVDAVTSLLDRFENVYGMIRYEESTHEIAILNHLKHSIVSGGKPVEDLLRRDIKAVKCRELIDFVFDHIENDATLNYSVRNVIRAYHESSHDTSHESYNESSDDTGYESSHESSHDTGYDRGDDRGDDRDRDRDRDIPPYNPPKGKTAQAYARDNLSYMSPTAMEELCSFIDDLNEDLVKHAVDVACENGKRTWRYAKAVLNRYLSEGIKSVSEAKDAEDARQHKKQEQEEQEEQPKLFGKFY